jgi:PAH dioxygenase large subunit
MRVCRADRDNVRFFRCVYHGWSYDREGRLVSAFAEQLYDDEHLRKEELGLIPVTQFASYRGLLFGTWDADVPPLEEYLGDFKFYIDLYLGRTDEGSEVVGVPHVWEVNSNWKFATDNFTGDNQHLYTAHGSTVELGMLPPDPMSLSYGHCITADGGHVLHVVPGPPSDEQFYGLPRELAPQFERNLTPAQLEVFKRHSFSVGTAFPNLSFLHVIIPREAHGVPTPFLALKFWEPTGPTTTRVHSYFLADKAFSPELRKASMETYVRTFGPSGIFEQDDMENWEDCTEVNSGRIAMQYDLHHGMSAHLDPDPSFPGPGYAYPSSYGERTQLAFYGEWLRWMTQKDPAVGRPELVA